MAERCLLLPLDAMELVVIKGVLDATLKCYETNPELKKFKRTPDGVGPYRMIKAVYDRMEDLYVREVRCLDH